MEGLIVLLVLLAVAEFAALLLALRGERRAMEQRDRAAAMIDQLGRRAEATATHGLEMRNTNAKGDA